MGFDPLRWESEWPERWRGKRLEPGRAVSLAETANSALGSAVLDNKVALTREAAIRWFEGNLPVGRMAENRLADRPGRPDKPRLVPPNKLKKKRSLNSKRGRVALLHAIAHIELNAIDLALDIIVRFSSEKLPRSFFDGWLRVAFEEAKHFSLLEQRLNDLGHSYGEFDAHDGLWEASQETAHSLRARLAVVPLILEARGLDITPSLLRQLHSIGDLESAEIFEVIYRDEQGHVAVGAKWFRFLCHKQGIQPEREFQQLVRRHFRGGLKPPFNDPARSRAGLTTGFYKALSAPSR